MAHLLLTHLLTGDWQNLEHLFFFTCFVGTAELVSHRWRKMNSMTMMMIVKKVTIMMMLMMTIMRRMWCCP